MARGEIREIEGVVEGKGEGAAMLGSVDGRGEYSCEEVDGPGVDAEEEGWWEGRAVSGVAWDEKVDVCVGCFRREEDGQGGVRV